MDCMHVYLFQSQRLSEVYSFLFHFSIYPVKQVFGEMEFVGWYTNGDTPSTDDSALHQQV